MKKAPELFLENQDTLLDPIVFEHVQKTLSVPSARIGRFDPTTGKPLANYWMMDDLINEMLHIKVQYKLDESSFVSMLLSQFSTESKNLGTQGNLTVLLLEQIHWLNCLECISPSSNLNLIIKGHIQLIKWVMT